MEFDVGDSGATHLDVYMPPMDGAGSGATDGPEDTPVVHVFMGPSVNANTTKGSKDVDQVTDASESKGRVTTTSEGIVRGQSSSSKSVTSRVKYGVFALAIIALVQ